MRLACFEIEARRRFGSVAGDTVTDLGAADGGGGFQSLLLGSPTEPPAPVGNAASWPLSSVTLLPPIANLATKVLALGWAYKSHQDETGHKADPFPFFFLKHSQSLVGHQQPIIRPSVSDSYDFEGEFVVVIGKPGRHIPESQAMEHVAGYSILMDGSVRDWQKHSVTAGKNFDRSSSFGPWIVMRDEVADPHALNLTTRLNGDVVQQASTSQLAWSIAYLVHYCSTFTALQTGDVISTGTPGGVGSKRTPPLWLRPGDVLEVEVSGVGTLSNTVMAE
jgi:2-keto-4-pentenoate hydratase/2-oxohepta-3-ene-1,7-dioic acid hydratase in catechol pathway